MKFKRIVSLLSAWMMVMALLAGWGGDAGGAAETGGAGTAEAGQTADPNLEGNTYKTGLPIVKDKITLKMVAGKAKNTNDFNEIETFINLEEKTNIKIEWDLIPQEGFNDRKSLILASNELPDAFFGTSAGGIVEEEAVTYGSQGVFLPLEKYIEDYAVNIKGIFEKLPDAKRVSTSLDGHIYTLPFIQEINANLVFTRMYINKSWLDKLSLPVPATTDELVTALKAFRDNDPNGNKKPDEIPLSFIYKNHNMGHYAMMGSFGCPDSKDHVAVKDKKAYITATMPEYKEAVKFFSSLYKENLIDKEVFTHDSSQYKAKGNQADALYGLLFDWGGTSVVGTERFDKDYVPLAPLKGFKGDQTWLVREPSIWSGYFVVTSANKYPEATLRWADQLYDEKTSMELQYGPIGLTLEETADGKIKMLDAPEGMTYNDFRYQKAPAITASAILADTFANKMIVNENMKVDDEKYQVYAPYLLKEFYPTSSVKFTKEQSSRMAALKTDIITHIDSMQAKWISGDSSIDNDWDAYLAELKKMGIDEMLKIYQDAYDTYMKQ